uniref:Uncharacterized protein n=1 Tax=Avena sativa TaxID=4498 RepID=A0ACD5ZKQ7_AVESA
MSSSSSKKWNEYDRENWPRDLIDIDCWLNGYRKAVEYPGYCCNKDDDFGVFWIVGAGPIFSFARAISGIISEKINNRCGPYEHVIKVDLKPTPTAKEAQGKGITSIKYQLTLAAAKELGLLDQEYDRLKEKHDQLQYYTYGRDGASGELAKHVQNISPLVGKLLASKKYMLVLNNLQWPIEPLSFTPDCGLPLLPWTRSQWLISPTSQDVYNESKSEDNGVFKSIYEDEHVVFLTIFALRQSAEHMLNTICQESIEYWHVIAINCFHYAVTIFANHSQVVAVTSDELIHQWAILLPRMTSTISSNSSKCSDMRRVGRVILEAFEKYSLLQLPFSPANEAREATNTGAQFFAYHGLIAESITVDELTDNKKKWISFVDMSNLEEFILVNCSNLVELPPSMVALSSLMVLEITGTQIKYFPHKIFEEMQKLKSLKLIDNNNLISLTRPVSRVHEIKLEGHPNLKSFSLIGAPHIKRLSLRRCGMLESVELKNLDALEELDLSSTSIKELPVEIPNGTQLRRLLLLGVPSMLRFPWQVQRLPEVFYFDQYPEGNGTHSGQVSQLCVSDPKFFYSFGKSCVDLVRKGQFFQSFSVQVTPCSTNYMRLQHEEETFDNKLQNFVQKQSTYMDIYNSCYAEETAIASPITIPVRRTERHVQITGMQVAPFDGLRNLLNVTKSISVTCDTSIGFFSYLSQYQDLEESRHVSEFSLLEHLHLEYCPRLEVMVPNAVTLPRLKTLDILFCYNLKKIFYEGDHPGWRYRLLPNLERIRLQELPLLQHFKDNDATIGAPMWKEHPCGRSSMLLEPPTPSVPTWSARDGEVNTIQHEFINTCLVNGVPTYIHPYSVQENIDQYCICPSIISTLVSYIRSDHPIYTCMPSNTCSCQIRLVNSCSKTYMYIV